MPRRRGRGQGVKGSGDDDDDGSDKPPQPKPSARCRNTPGIKLLRQYFAAALRLYDYISFPTVSGIDDTNVVFAQVLGVERKQILVKTWDGDEELKEDALFKVDLQVLEKCSPRLADPDAIKTPDAECDVFVFAEPCTVDFLSVLGTDMDTRHEVRRWEAKLSDIEACTCLHSATILRPEMDVMSAKTPALSLMDELEKRGYTATASLVLHQGKGKRSPKTYDSRQAASKRWYYRCLLVHAELCRAKCGSFRSDRSAAWFELLFRTRKPLPDGMSAKDCRVEMAKLDGDADAEVPLDDKSVGAGACLPTQADTDHGGSSVDSEIAGDDEMLNEPLLVPPPSQPRAADPHRKRKITEVAGDAADETVFPDTIEGCRGQISSRQE